MYNEHIQPISLEELDIRQLIAFWESEDEPLIKICFSLDTPYLKRDFDLDLIIWNLSDDNIEQTERVIQYVLKNFNKLFETGWTVLYHHLCEVDSNVAEHTVQEFYEEQIDFDENYYTIQLEINCEHLKDGQARYCFVVATTCDCNKWMISSDDMRVYMIGNKACGFNDNNDDLQMRDSLEICQMFYQMEWMLDVKLPGFQYAEPFQ